MKNSSSKNFSSEKKMTMIKKKNIKEGDKEEEKQVKKKSRT